MLRTSLKDEIYRGNLLYVERRFYLLADDVQEAPNCFMTHVTPCLHFVKVSRKVNPQTDKFGFAVEDTGERLHPLIDILTLEGNPGEYEVVSWIRDSLTAKQKGGVLTIQARRKP